MENIRREPEEVEGGSPARWVSSNATPEATADSFIAANPKLSPRVATWLTKYRPKSIPRDRWETKVRWFVIPALVELAPKGIPMAQHCGWVLSNLAAWCVEQGLELDREVALHPATVDRFCLVGLKGLDARSQYRTMLRAIGPKLTRKAPWPPRSIPMNRRKVVIPYSPEKVAGYREDAQRQSTAVRRRAGRAIVALGAGAGLDGRWSVHVRGPDVVRRGGVILVSVGEPSARVVPVLAEFEDDVLELAADAGEHLLVGGEFPSRNRASNIVRKFETGHGRPRLNASRLRSAWLVRHLAMGTRLPELAAAAGLEGVGVLTELLSYVPPLDEDDALRMLRGGP